MYKDPIDTLLLCHYGPDSATPDALEQRLINSVRQDAITQHRDEHAMSLVLAHRMSRRRAMKFVAAGTAGLGLLGASLEVLDTALFGGNATQTTQSALS